MGPLEVFLISSATIFFIYIAWFLLFADCDMSLTLKILFGRPVSVFKRKVIWITGASSGLGEAMAYELASVGARLILSARNAERLQQVKKKCLEVNEGGLDRGDILVLPFDITDFDDHKNKMSKALDHFKQIDVLINNAGRAQIGSCRKTNIDVDRDLLNINYLGPIHLTKLMLRHFQETGKGRIVCISSLSGKYGVPCAASYSATKHALQGFYDSVRIECSNQNIKVTMVCPGIFESEMANHAMTETGQVHQNIIKPRIQMPTSRCAHLSLVAAANNSYEAWISYQPVLLVPYLTHWLPDLSTFIFQLFFTDRIRSALLQGNESIIPAWKPLFNVH